MTFTLKITLGNDAMQTGYDIAQALRETATDLEENHCESPEVYPFKPSGNIRDLNGNTVGKWGVK